MPEIRNSAFPEGTMNEKLRELRDKWSEEIPERIITSLSKPNTFKIRINWFQSLVGVLADGIEKGRISDPRVKEEAEKFMSKVVSDEWAKRLTTAEGIQMGNRIIDLVLGEQR